jgi:DNA polymerase
MITCYNCDICKQNDYHPLFGDGNPDAILMFVSRNPLSKEHKADVPFLGKDGELFQVYLDLFGFHRDNIFITNAVKCTTPHHRVPTEVELTNCRPYLFYEIMSVKPRIIVLLGLTAIRSYFNIIWNHTNLDMNILNGRVTAKDNTVIFFMHHPYHALNNKKIKIEMFISFIKLLNLYRSINPNHQTLIGL